MEIKNIILKYYKIVYDNCLPELIFYKYFNGDGFHMVIRKHSK